MDPTPMPAAPSPPARYPAPPTTSALSPVAFSLGLGAIAAIGLSLLELRSPFLSQLGQNIVFAPPLLALSACVLAVVALARGTKRGERVWMGVTAIVSGVLVLATWTAAAVLISIDLSQI